MVALCAQHHGEADNGAFTDQQLRGFKDNRLNGARKRLEGRFNWRRERLFVIAGRNLWIGCKVLLKCAGQRIIWLTTNEDGYELLNLDLYDRDGKARLRMRSNDWLVDDEVGDLECPPNGASLEVRTRTLDAELSIEFARVAPSLLRRHAIEIMGSPKHIPAEYHAFLRATNEEVNTVFEKAREDLRKDDSALCMIRGRLKWPTAVRIEANRIVFPGENVMSGSLLSKCRVGIEVA
jgi:hypothetical protein